MAGRRSLSRESDARDCCSPLPPPRPDPRLFPTQQHPRYRLRVFDRCWPWRARYGEALADALASRNARRDLDDKAVYLDACANVQRDPPEWPWRVVR